MWMTTLRDGFLVWMREGGSKVWVLGSSVGEGFVVFWAGGFDSVGVGMWFEKISRLERLLFELGTQPAIHLCSFYKKK